MPTKTTHKGLGKGLAALISEQPINQQTGFVPDLDIKSISPNPNQPRISIAPEDLIGLADSIREHGILEPLIVTKVITNTESAVVQTAEMQITDGKIVSTATTAPSYQLVAGERRLRAAILAQLKTVPVIIKELSPQQILELALIENIQRKDLNPLEEANAFSELYHNYRVTLEVIAKKVGRDISTISNKMRLLRLPDKIKEGLLREEISESHAYLLLSLKSKDAMLAAYNIIAKKQLSIRQSDELIRRITLANKAIMPTVSKLNSVVYDEKTQEIQQNLADKLGKGFRLVRKKNGGRITIPFMSDEQLEKIYEFVLKL